MIGVGHKGADALVRGNTLASFEAAAAVGVPMIEFDVLWLRDGAPELPAAERSELVVAHDWGDAGAREPLTLEAALEALTRPPLDRLEFDLDIKLPGREEEIAEALRRHDLVGRATFSGAHLETPPAFAAAEPGLRRGWTFPKVKRPWDRRPWAKPGVALAIAIAKRRMPRMIRARIREFGLWAVWVYHPLITRRLVEAVDAEGAKLFAWTVDDPGRVAELTRLGVHGICSNDPRLLV